MLRRSLVPSLLVLVLGLGACSHRSPGELGATAQQVIAYTDTFDSGKWSDRWGVECPFSYTCRVVANPQGTGNVMRFAYRESNDDGSRPTQGAELRTYEKIPFAQNSEFWYGFKIYFPSDGMRADSKEQIVTQWHGRPDEDKGEDWRSPVAAIVVKDDAWHFECAYSRKEVNVNQDRKKDIDVAFGKVPKDRWVSFVFHLAFDPFGGGVVEVWRDGEQVFSRRDVNCGYNDVIAPYFKYGLYNYRGSDHAERSILFDEVRVRGAEARYADVAPGGSAPRSPGAPVGETVSLKAVNGRYVNADSTRLIANRAQVSRRERFKVVSAGGGKVALRAEANGKYVSTTEGGLNASGSSVGPENRFYWEVEGNAVCLKSERTFRYVVAESAGKAPLKANRKSCSSWERFSVGVVR